MKKIIILIPSLGIGGQEKIAISNYEILKKHHDVKLVVFFETEKSYQFSDDLINLNIKHSKNKLKKIINQLKRIFKLNKIVKDQNIDLIYSFGSSANITSTLIKYLRKIKVVISIHGIRSVKLNIIKKIIWNKADFIICISKGMASKLISLIPKVKSKIKILNNGYDIRSIF